MKLIARGAEAELYLDKDKVVKDRIKKDYRHEIIDNFIRKRSTRKEVKLLQKASKLIPVPDVISTIDSAFVEMPNVAPLPVAIALTNDIAP